MKRLDRYKKYKSLQDLIHYRLENQSEEIAEHFRDLEDDFPIEIEHESRLVSRWIKRDQRSDKVNVVESIITMVPIYGFNFLHLQDIIPRIESIISRAESMSEFTTCPESPHFDNGRIGKILIVTNMATWSGHAVTIDLDRELKWESIKDKLLDKIGPTWNSEENKIYVIKLYFTQL